MSEFTPVKILVTTDGSGDATGYSEASYNGELCAVQWIDGTFGDGVDAVLSVTNTDAGVDYTLLTLTNANDDAFYLPRAATVDASGAASLYAAAGTAVNGKMPVVGKLKLVVSGGGDTKTGGLVVFLEC